MFRTIALAALAAVAALAMATSTAAASQPAQVSPHHGTYMGTDEHHNRITFSYDAKRGEVVGFAVNHVVKVRNAYARFGQMSTSDNGFDLAGRFSRPTAVSGTYAFSRNGKKVTVRWSANAFAS